MAASECTYYTRLIALAEIPKGRVEVRGHRQNDMRSRTAFGSSVIVGFVIW